jgi:NAD(P)H-nitrite reductase large subunit
MDLVEWRKFEKEPQTPLCCSFRKQAIMRDFHYLIIGGGMTGDAAVKGIRSVDKKGTIALISSEDHSPYSRPPLTKGLWKGDDEASIWKKTSEHDVTIILSRTITEINPENKTVEDNLGEEYTYNKLLLATGGVVNQLPFHAGGIIYYRNMMIINCFVSIARLQIML